jgi:hypothetical protein
MNDDTVLTDCTRVQVCSLYCAKIFTFNFFRNILTTNRMHLNVYDVFESHFSHQHFSAAIVAIFRVKLLQEYKCTMLLAVTTQQTTLYLFILVIISP